MSDLATVMLNLSSLILLAIIRSNCRQEHSFAALSIIKEAGEWRWVFWLLIWISDLSLWLLNYRLSTWKWLAWKHLATVSVGMFTSEWSLSFQLSKLFRWPRRVKCIISRYFIFIKTVWTWKWGLMVPFSEGWRSLGVSVQKEKTMCNPSGIIIERNSVVITALHGAGGCYKYWNWIW